MSAIGDVMEACKKCPQLGVDPCNPLAYPACPHGATQRKKKVLAWINTELKSGRAPKPPAGCDPMAMSAWSSCLHVADSKVEVTLQYTSKAERVFFARALAACGYTPRPLY